MTTTLVRRALATLLILGCAGSARAEDGIVWYQDLNRASEAAQKANLPMFVDFWADWCASCKVMDETVYTDARVIEAFRSKVIGVRLNFDLQPDLARKFDVGALPYLVFTNSYGTPLVYHRGVLDADTLTKVVEAMPPLAEINRLDRSLQADKNDAASLVAMAQALRAAGFYEASTNFYQRASKNRAVKADAVLSQAVLYEMSLNWLELRNGKAAAQTLEKWLDTFPQHARTPDALLALARAYALDDNAERARKSLTSLLDRFPQSPAARDARAMLEGLGS